jgi:hypothetical protein
VYPPVGHHSLRASLRLQTTSFERLDGAAAQRDLIHVIDADQVRSWTPLLRPLEDDTVRVVVIGEHDLPAAITSRLPVYHAGLLTEIDVTQILARDHPRLSPRPVIARLAHGSLADLDRVVAIAQALGDVETHLADRTRPDLRQADPLVVLGAVHAICRSRIGLIAPPVSDAARAAIPLRLAHEMLHAPAWTTKHEARNNLTLFFAHLRG